MGIITKIEKRNQVRTLLDEFLKYNMNKAGMIEDQYLYWSPFCPKEQIPVGAHLEPVVVAAGWDLDHNHVLTCNMGNNLILNSKSLLILDIDFGDRRLNKWCAHRNLQDVIDCFQDLAALDAHRTPSPLATDDPLQDILRDDQPTFLWSQQTWRLYATPNGCRAVCTSMPFPLDWRAAQEFRSLAKFLGADPLYCQKCIEQKCYRARLTSKRLDAVAASFAAGLWGRPVVHPDLQAVLALHDLVAENVVDRGCNRYEFANELAYVPGEEEDRVLALAEKVAGADETVLQAGRSI